MNTPLINNIANKSINPKYLPNKEKYGEEYGGYRNKTEEIIFNKFAAMSNDISFICNNIKYYIYKRNNIVKVYNANIKEVIKEYLNETEFLESFSINGIPFIELIDEISDANAYIDVFTPYLALDKEGFPYNCKYKAYFLNVKRFLKKINKKKSSKKIEKINFLSYYKTVMQLQKSDRII